jgi:Ca-activated chloride channel family protein
VSELSFAEGIWRYLAAVSVVVLVVAYSLDFTRRRHALERIGHLPQLERMMASLSEGYRVAKAILLVTGIALVIASLARPQTKGETKWQKRGIDVAVVMDYSKSMLARDMAPSRVERMEREVIELLDDETLENDRIAVIAFAGAAAHFPLTHDHEAAKLLFDGLTPMEMPPGSDLGEAIRRARCVVRPDLLGDPSCEGVGGRGHGGDPLDRRADPTTGLATSPKGTERARAIVIFTDGEDTEETSAAELEAAVRLDIDVYIIGVGTPSGELIPEFDPKSSGPSYKRDVTGWRKSTDGKSFVFTRLEEGALEELANLAGGEDHYYRLDPTEIRTEELVERLEKLKQGDLDERMVAIPKEAFQWLLFPAFMLLLIEATLAERRRRPKQ